MLFVFRVRKVHAFEKGRSKTSLFFFYYSRPFSRDGCGPHRASPPPPPPPKKKKNKKKKTENATYTNANNFYMFSVNYFIFGVR